jgi:hypothetical protein
LRDAGDAQLWGYAKDEELAARRLREPHARSLFGSELETAPALLWYSG